MCKSRIKKRKIGLWTKDPHCHWCGQLTVIYDYESIHHKPMPDNCATLDHLRSRLNPSRYEKAGPNEERTVLACFRCNTDRGIQEEQALTKEELRQRSRDGHMKSGIV